MSSTQDIYDAIIIGAGTSGSYVALGLVQGGMKCLMLEAGHDFDKNSYPQSELDANSQLFWGGGVELNSSADIGFLRPKVVGGGSVVNQALMDRFDDLAFDSWREASGVDYFTREYMEQWYDKAAEQISIQTVPEAYRNGNADVFRNGFEANGYCYAPLQRAQKDCGHAQGNSCIVCLGGCKRDSKQSTPITGLKRAREAGLELRADFEVEHIEARDGEVRVGGRGRDGSPSNYRARRLVLAAGAIGNSKLLLASGFQSKLPALGHNFHTHPQYMNLALYEEPVDAFKGPLQSYKSADHHFRHSGFKLENVFAPPVAIAMLIPGFGRLHQRYMKKMRHFACIEVAVRDSSPGRIRLKRNGDLLIEKTLNDEDKRRRDNGRDALRNIFYATGASEIIEGNVAIGLHLQGGCNMGLSGGHSVTGPDFKLHGYDNIYTADSSIFPNAPGLNPAFTIMALSIKAAADILAEEGR